MGTWIESLDIEKYMRSVIERASMGIEKRAQGPFNQLKTLNDGINARISTYTALNSLFSTLQSQIQTLTSSFNGSTTVASSNTSIATATVSGTAVPGNHSLVVNTLAQAEQVASTNVYSSVTSALNMTDTLTLTVGGTNINVNVASTDALQDVVNNINAAAAVNNLGVTAYIAATGSNTYQLVVGSTQAGTANAVSLSESGTGSNAFAISMSGPGGTGTGTELTQAKDATFTLDNLSYDMTSNSNTIGGLAINLVSAAPGTTVTLTVSQSNPVTDVQTALQNVITTYNQIMTTIGTAQSQNGRNDPALNDIQSLFTSIINTQANTNTLSGMYILPQTSVTPITPTSAPATLQGVDWNISPAAWDIYPTGLLTVGSDPSQGTFNTYDDEGNVTSTWTVPVTNTFATQLAANFTADQSALVGASGIFTQISNLLTQSSGAAWKALNDPTTASTGIPNGLLPAAQQEYLANSQSMFQIQIDAQSKKDALKEQYSNLAKVLVQWQMQAMLMRQEIEVMQNS